MMDVIKTDIDGLVIVKPKVFVDDRGYFMETYNRRRYVDNGIDFDFVQDNLSCSKKGVVRGLHFQVPPFEQCKLVTVLRGSVMDVAVDLRKNSPTYGQHLKVELSDKNGLQLLIPGGFAHGFVALEDDTLFYYKCNNWYSKEHERCIVYDDSSLNIDWGVEDAVLTEKDRSGERFDGFITPF